MCVWFSFELSDCKSNSFLFGMVMKKTGVVSRYMSGEVKV